MYERKNQLRIIAGKWKSRRINFLPLTGVRPTTDANRETLFNWLQDKIRDAICLDLFAGSGALGFEALSRGAKHVTMVDSSIKIIQNLKENAQALNATESINFICAKVPEQFVKISPQKFDIIFLDPPFHKNLVAPICEILENMSFVANDGYVYIETEKELDISNILPKPWQILRTKLSGQVRYHLIQKQA